MAHAHAKPFAFGRSVRLGMVAALAVLAISVPAGLAQDASPVAEATASHPVHIHTGTCAELGDVVFPLTSVEALSGEAVGPDSAHAVKTSITYLDVSLDDIVAGGHAINVHLSGEEIGTYIACGDIGGPEPLAMIAYPETGERDGSRSITRAVATTATPGPG